MSCVFIIQNYAEHVNAFGIVTDFFNINLFPSQTGSVKILFFTLTGPAHHAIIKKGEGYGNLPKCIGKNTEYRKVAEVKQRVVSSKL